MSSILLSIVVPTRNRKDYAFETVKQILAIADQRIQLVIQDNSDTINLQDDLEEFKNDKRLKYKYHGKELSFVDNFSLAVSNADGEYVCAIGDDDGVNPFIGEIVSWAKENSVSSIQYKMRAVYVWPGSGIYAQDDKRDMGSMVLGKPTCFVYKADPISEIKKLLKNGCQNYLRLNLIKIYHGIVKKECLEQVKNKTGNYFKGLSPDIYSAVALSLVSKNNVFIDYPLTISGICKKSGAADSATGKHTGDWKNAPHFKGHLNYIWDEKVPKIYSVETIWADSSLAAVRDFDCQTLNFNVPRLTAYCLVKYPQYKKILLHHYFGNIKQNKRNPLFGYFALAFNIVRGPLIDFIIRVLNRITRRKGDFEKLIGLVNISEAQVALTKSLNKKNITLDSLLLKLKQFENE